MTPVWNILEISVATPLSSDRELVERFRQGDPEAFTTLYRAHSPAVYRFAFHMTADPIKGNNLLGKSMSPSIRSAVTAHKRLYSVVRIFQLFSSTIDKNERGLRSLQWTMAGVR